MLKKMIEVIFKGLRVMFKQSNSVIVPPSGFGSVGDDAMVRVLMRHIRNQSLMPVIMGGNDAHTWACVGAIKLADSKQKILTAINLIMLLLKSQKLYIIGADIMDGHYDPDSVHKRLKLARLFSDIGIDVIITGFSFNDHPANGICQNFRTLKNVSIFLRDDKSLERFVRHTGCDAKLSADLAFLTQCSDSSENVNKIITWVDEKKRDDKTVIIVNINWLPFRHSGITVDELIDKYHDICLGISHKLRGEVSFLLVPNDFRDPEKLGDCKLAELLHKKLAPELGDECEVVDSVFNAEELKLFSKKCDFVITGRMHLAIICATNAIPSFSVSYQQKFSGFYKHIGLDPANLMVEPSDVLKNDIVKNIIDNIQNKRRLHQLISDNLPNVEELAKRNL